MYLHTEVIVFLILFLQYLLYSVIYLRTTGFNNIYESDQEFASKVPNINKNKRITVIYNYCIFFLLGPTHSWKNIIYHTAMQILLSW